MLQRVPYSEKELNPTGIQKTMLGDFPVYDTPVTPRENYRAAVNHEKPLWIPTYFDTEQFCPRCIPDNMARCLVMEKRMLAPEENVGGKDMFGIDWVYVPVAGGSMVKPGNPLLEDANDWKQHLKIPDIDSWDWEGTREANIELLESGRPIYVWLMTGFFERLISFMDFEGAILALVDEEQKNAVHEIFEFLCDVYEKIILKYIEYFNMDTLYIHDDWGSQRAPFFSLETCREMIVPHMKRLSDFCHEHNVFFELHSCGQVELLIPAMIDAGVDIWAGQPMNDKIMLYEKYGDQIMFGLDYDLKPDTPDEEKVAVLQEFVKKFGPNMKTKPVYSCDFMMGVKGRETLYVESRKILG